MDRTVLQTLAKTTFEGIEYELSKHVTSAEEILGELSELDRRLSAVTPVLAFEEAALRVEKSQARASFRTMLGGNRKHVADIERRHEAIRDLYFFKDRALSHLQETEQV